MSHPHLRQMSEIEFKKAKRSPQKIIFSVSSPNVAPPLLPDVGDFIQKSEKKPPQIIFSVSSQMSHPHFCQMSEISF